MTLLPYSPTSAMQLNELVESVLVSLYGQTSQSDASTSLTSGISASDLTFTVDDPSDLSKGLIEIDMELLRITDVDLTTAVVTVAPTGRGSRATQAASHAAGAEVRVQPIIPYASVVRAIRLELSAIYPRISAVCSTEFTASPTVGAYELPSEAGVVLDVRYKDTLGEWQRIRGWEVEHGQNQDDIASGKVLRLSAPSSATVRVIYGKPFGKLDQLTDTLADAGIPESLEEVLETGAVCRLLPTLDTGRLSATSTSASEANSRPPSPGTGVMLTRELRAVYRDRLEQEIKTFRSYFPIRLHQTR